ncbi:MAG: helix-turn-helix transcriptional regulator [Deltaproteobacteria bacterium]|nr:helix-turn-helix transcriptional regulator [Deltaproteobacteria bacterium]
MKCAESIRTLRRRLGLSQKAVAIEADLRRQTLSGIESGRINPTKVEAGKIAKALSVHTREVLACLRNQRSRIWTSRKQLDRKKRR